MFKLVFEEHRLVWGNIRISLNHFRKSLNKSLRFCLTAQSNTTALCPTLQNQVLCMRSNWWPTMETERVTVQKDWCPLQNMAWVTQDLVSLIKKSRILWLERIKNWQKWQHISYCKNYLKQFFTCYIYVLKVLHLFITHSVRSMIPFKSGSSISGLGALGFFGVSVADVDVAITFLHPSPALLCMMC